MSYGDRNEYRRHARIRINGWTELPSPALPRGRHQTGTCRTTQDLSLPAGYSECQRKEGVNCGTMATARVVFLILFAGIATFPCFSADSFQAELQRNLKDQILVLRQPVAGQKVEFGETATATPAEPGSLQFDSVIQVRKIKLNKTNLTLEAIRLWPFYDEKLKRVAFTRTDSKLRIRIAGSSAETIRTSLVRIFLNADEMEQFWKPLEVSFKDTEVFRVGSNVSAPQPLYQPEAEYPQAARNLKKTGTVLLQVIVGADGLVRNIQIKRPLGGGLDEKAVEAVKRWRFQPALKDGKPVAVVVNIEIGFNLY
jgi:TonB family protein